MRRIVVVVLKGSHTCSPDSLRDIPSVSLAQFFKSWTHKIMEMEIMRLLCATYIVRFKQLTGTTCPYLYPAASRWGIPATTCTLSGSDKKMDTKKEENNEQHKGTKEGDREVISHATSCGRFVVGCPGVALIRSFAKGNLFESRGTSIGAKLMGE